MAVRMNLWSLTLLPGEKYPLYVRRDFVVTNAALGEELVSNDGRSVVKVTHNPIPPSAFDDSDSEDDSDFEIDSEDDEELDSDEEEETAGEIAAAVKAEDIELDDEEEDEDEDEDDSEDDSEFDDEIEETNVICSLTAGKTEQATLNLTFVEGEVVMFEATGENAVHLLGNYIDQFPDEESSDDDDEYDSEFDGEDDYSDIYGSDDEIELDTEEEEAVAKITAIPEEKPKVKKAIVAAEVVPKKAAAAAAVDASKPSQKRKADAVESSAANASAGDISIDGLSKSQKKKLAKKAKLDSESAPAPAAAAAPAPVAAPVKKEAKPQKRTLASGLVIEDVKVGSGPVAKTGKRLGMRYIGKLTTGKQFDANTGGKPFTFVLGKGEVIRGWDEGLAGMAVGGERKLSIPPQLAYGSQKLPGIPKNSTLNFEVKLVSIN